MTLIDDPAARADKPLVVMVLARAGTGSSSTARAERGANVAGPCAVTLRGHGADPVRRGDVNHVGQLQDDLAHAICDLAPQRKLVMPGHSSGGGLVGRVAGGRNGDMIDAAIRLAPFPRHDASTTRADAGGRARPPIRRIVGPSTLDVAVVTQSVA